MEKKRRKHSRRKGRRSKAITISLVDYYWKSIKRAKKKSG
jgi:hypothetical protein